MSRLSSKRRKLKRLLPRPSGRLLMLDGFRRRRSCSGSSMDMGKDLAHGWATSTSGSPTSIGATAREAARRGHASSAVESTGHGTAPTKVTGGWRDATTRVRASTLCSRPSGYFLTISEDVTGYFLLGLVASSSRGYFLKIPEDVSSSWSPPLVARKGCQGRRVWTTIAPSCETPIRGWTRPLPVGKDPRPSRMRRLDRTGVELALEES